METRGLVWEPFKIFNVFDYGQRISQLVIFFFYLDKPVDVFKFNVK